MWYRDQELYGEIRDNEELWRSRYQELGRKLWTKVMQIEMLDDTNDRLGFVMVSFNLDPQTESLHTISD